MLQLPGRLLEKEGEGEGRQERKKDLKKKINANSVVRINFFRLGPNRKSFRSQRSGGKTIANQIGRETSIQNEERSDGS